MPENHRPILLPILFILCGLLFQLQAMGLLGPVNTELLQRFWPLLFIAAGLDHFFCQRRILGGIILTFSGLILIVANIGIGTNANSEAWDIFIKFWPILLFLYGVDSLFYNRSLVSTVIGAAAFLVGIYAILNTIGIPIFKNAGTSNGPSFLNKPIIIAQTGTPAAQAVNEKNINYVMPSQSSAILNFSPVSGKIEIRTNQSQDRILFGKITSDKNGSFQEQSFPSTDQADQIVYNITGNPADTSGNSVWNMEVSSQKLIRLNVSMTNGYEIINMRDMQLTDAIVANVKGNIDVMLPAHSSTEPLQITAKNGDIRVYIPKGSAAHLMVNGTESLEIPDGYVQSGNQVYPTNQDPNIDLVMVKVETTTQHSVKIKLDSN